MARAACSLMAALTALALPALFITVSASAAPPPVVAAEPQPAPVDPALPAINQPIQLKAGSGVLLRLAQPAATVMSAQPEVARVQPASPTSLFLMGVAPGHTTVIATTTSGAAIVTYDVSVVGNGQPQLGGNLPVILGTQAPVGVTEATARAIAAAINQTVQGADVRARAVEHDVIISGTLPTAGAVQQAVSIARAYVGDLGGVINETLVLESLQVNVRVRIAEINRSITRQLGFNWQALGSNTNFSFGLLTGAGATSTISALRPLGAPTLTGSTSGPYQVGAGIHSSHLDINGVIDALAADQLISILAEPNLTALSGETASFLAGGEFPIPVSSNSSGGAATITVAFKQYGVSLSVVPTVISGARLNLRVRPEVSQLSSTGAVSVPLAGGTLTIPALTVRRAETTIELGSGQSFAIAGLLERTSSNTTNALPFLGEIPVLGPLFKSNDFQQGETELVIIVTPYLVKPAISASALQLPTDDFRPATDLDRILLGRQVATSGSEQPLDAGFILK